MPVATLKMTITPEMEKMLKCEPFFLEIEMLQGKIRNLQDGMTEYVLEISDEHKAELLKEFVLKMISKSHQAIEN